MTGTLRGLNSAQADGMRSHGGKKKKEKTDAEVSAEEVQSNFSVNHRLDPRQAFPLEAKPSRLKPGTG